MIGVALGSLATYKLVDHYVASQNENEMTLNQYCSKYNIVHENNLLSSIGIRLSELHLREFGKKPRKEKDVQTNFGTTNIYPKEFLDKYKANIKRGIF